MQFEFTSKYKIPAIVLMVLGGISIGVSFASGDVTRSWASLLLGNYFFMAIALAATFFLAVQFVAEVGWSVVIKRVLMSFGRYLIPSTIFMVLIFVFGHHYIYHWTHEGLTDPNSEHYDSIIAGKSGYLNVPFYTIRLICYALIWSGFAFLMRKWSLQEDELGGLVKYNKMTKYSAVFLVLYGVTSSTSAWDVIMSIDAHWFSTLFGWYTFASLFVTGLSMIALVTIHLKRKGYLPNVNQNHIHDLGKFMFAFSIFWTYLYFSQFMLYWYANIPEEVTYFIFRQDHYRIFFIGMLAINFGAPFLILMTRNAKRLENYVVVAAILIIIGHWFDFFMMIMPGTVGEHWHLGITEIGTSLFFLGLFLYMLFSTLSKTPLVPKNHPMLEESVHFHV
jgi:hypothetical protein